MREEVFIDMENLPDPLTKEELEKLFEINDRESKEKILIHNIRLVIYLVEKYYSLTEYDKKDLVSVGIMGLMKAIDSFDLSKKIKFNTYASTCITNEIKMFFRKNNKHGNNESLDMTIINDNEGNELKLHEIISNDDDVQNEFIKKEEKVIINELVEELPEQEREIIKMYMGFYDGKKYTGKEIGEKYNLSQSYISRKIKEILIILKKEMKNKKINPRNIK